MGSGASTLPLPPQTIETLLAKEAEKPLDGADLDPATAIEEVRRLRRILSDPATLGTGKIIIHYNQYHEPFEIQNSMISVEHVDEEYCLSDIMPGCELDLIPFPLSQKYDMEEKGKEIPFATKDDDGKNWTNLYTCHEYWIVVHEDAEARARDMALVKARIQAEREEMAGKESGKRVEAAPA